MALSMTLTVVNLATALKDIIELGGNIKRSSTKVSENMQRAQRLAGEIRGKLDELEAYCDQNYEMLESSPRIKLALKKLSLKLNAVDASCYTYNSTPSTGWKNRLSTAFQARSCKRIETEISELKDDIDKFYIQFTVFLGLDNGLELAKLRLAHAEGLSHTSKMTHHMTSVNNRCIHSLSSRHPVITSPPPEKNYLNYLYLRHQVELMMKVITTKEFDNTSTGVSGTVPTPTSSFWLEIDRHSHQDNESLHRRAIGLTIEISNLLRSRSTTPDLRRGGLLMNNLAFCLSHLNMPIETKDVCRWTVKLCRHPSSVNPKLSDSTLIHQLRNLAISYRRSGNLTAASTAIHESITLSQRLLGSTSPTESVLIWFQYGNILTEQACIADLRGDPEQSWRIAEEAVDIFEFHLKVDKSFAYRRVDGVLEIDPQFLISLRPTSMVHDWYLHKYAWALHQLSASLHHSRLISESVDAKMKSIAIMDTLFRSNPGSSLDLSVAFSLYDLICFEDFAAFFPGKRLLEYANQTISIYQKYATLYPSQYRTSLSGPLCAKASILWRLGRHKEAVDCWKKMAELARNLVLDEVYIADILYNISLGLSGLEYHDEAIIIAEESIYLYEKNSTDAIAEKLSSLYLNLSGELYLSGRYEDTIPAAHEAIERYRALPSEDPTTKNKQIAQSLTWLTQALLRTGYRREALEKGHAALTIYSDLAYEDPSIVRPYTDCLWENDKIALCTDKESLAIDRSREVLHHFRTLSQQYPHIVTRLAPARAQLHLARNLHRFSHDTEAAHLLEELLNEWADKYGPIEDVEPASLKVYMWSLFSYSNILHSQGRTNKSLEALERSITVSTSLSNTNPDIASASAAAQARRVLRLCELGRFSDALKASNEAVYFCRNTTLEHVDDLVCCLQSAATAGAHVSTLGPKAIIAIAQEAVKEHQPLAALFEYSHHNKYALFGLPDSLTCLSMSHAEARNTPKALKYAKLAVEKIFALTSEPMLSWMDIEPKYAAARENLAVCLVESGDVPGAIDVLTEVQGYHTARAKTRVASCVPLGSVLHTLGILYCSVGQHEEGHAAARKLSDLMAQLMESRSELRDQLDVQILHQLKRRSSVALRAAEKQLQCYHRHVRVYVLNPYHQSKQRSYSDI